jgi:quaternary ammonium compound-resistance protein SugE
MAWAFLLIAGACEIVATTVFRYVDGYTKLWPTTAFIVLCLFSFYLLNRSLVGIPLGSAYAVWTGIGAAGTAIVGMAFYGEPVTAMRLVCLAMLVCGIIGLKIFAPS